VANDLLPRPQADPQLGRFWAHRREDGVKREKQLLIDFLCASAGGPMYGLPSLTRVLDDTRERRPIPAGCYGRAGMRCLPAS
jgi:hypothetical protein